MSSKIKILFLTFVVCFLVLWLYVKFLSPPQFKAVFLDVGQGDSTLVFLKNGSKILIDCGPDQKILRKLNEQFDFFDRQIDYLLVTHPDLDHYGGCIDVLRRYDVKNIFLNGATKDKDPTFLSWQEYLIREKTNVFTVEAPYEYFLNGTRLKFYNPDPEFIMNKTGDNDKSLVFKFFYNTTTIFFTGDLEAETEEKILQKYCFINKTSCPELQSDYLKIGHHGSDGSSTENFLKAVSPQQAIISVGKNKYGHPGLRILKRLQRLGIEFLRTDQKGDIIVK